MNLRTILKRGAIALAAAVVFSAVLVMAGCVSTKAGEIQTEHATFNRTTLEGVSSDRLDFEKSLVKIAYDKQVELLERDDAREQEVARTKGKALESRDAYWMRFIAAKDWHDKQTAKANAYDKATGELAKGYEQQAQMSLKQGEIATALASDALSAALAAAPGVYAAFAPGANGSEAPPASGSPAPSATPSTP